MTDQRELDRLLGVFFVDGADELADRVIDAALDQLDHTQQRRALRMPWRFSTMNTSTRLAAAAVIGVLAVGGTLYLLQPGRPGVGGPGPTPSASATPTPAPTPSPTPTPTGPMSNGRQIHTATLLADGRVLVAGGYEAGNITLASADLYDPATDTFSATGSLAAARGSHTATLLSDGRVLVAGGGPASWSVGDAFLTSAELYDPTTGTFSPTGSVTAARGFHTATLLADGRVLITGGHPAAWSATGPFIASAELYDPTTGTFSPTGSMTVGRESHAATLLADGRVLITGGVTNTAPSLASAELYDPTTGTFSPTGSLATARDLHTATLLSGGRVLVAGGLARGRAYADDPQFLALAELYDPAGSFSATGPMTERRARQMATLLADGRVLVTGGSGDFAAPLASAELFDPATGTFSPAGAGG
ncbi:MAG: hypothetical protein A2X23_06310 [Chloroflexi bacterium GWC2_73_18]|nr:MAG: hypothetical protein A2X23_06310 [Chloroflexi bacterium GWC2_73_18]